MTKIISHEEYLETFYNDDDTIVKISAKELQKAESKAWQFGFDAGLITTGLTLFVGFLAYMYVDKKNTERNLSNFITKNLGR